MIRPCLIQGAALTLALLAPLAAGAQSLTIGTSTPSTSADPHFYYGVPNVSLAMHIFDRLIDRDARTNTHPGLALSWTAVDDHVWEMKLRPGVKWSDGQSFTAEDVAFSLQRAPNVPGSPGGFGGMTRRPSRVEVVDPLTIRMHYDAPHPLFPVEMSLITMVSRHVGQTATTADYNRGPGAIGTGPYRLASYVPGERAELVRNDAYWAGRQPWQRVEIRAIPNDAARTAALLAGDVDVIDQVAGSDRARLQRDPRVTMNEIQGLRVMHLMPDFSRTGEVPFVTDNAGRPLERNPFLDVRVRRALSLAINREALASRVMEGAALPTGQWLPPGVFSYNPEVGVPPFDPDGARRLLAEAGFPQGFKLTLHSPNDRYPNDARVAQAVAQMWTRVGVQTQVEASPFASFATRSARQEFGIRLAAWGSSTGEGSYLLTNVVGTFSREIRRGSSNAGRYSNPALDALTARATATIDDAAREAMLREAVRIVAEEVPTIFLMNLTNSWASRRGLRYDARMDERTIAMGVTRD